MPISTEVRSIIDKIKSFDLKTTDVKVIKENISLLKHLSLLATKFPAGSFVVRGRSDTDPANVFRNPAEICYRKDLQNITEFNRASSPKVSLFYGCIRNDNHGDNKAEDACFALSIHESSGILHNTSLADNQIYEEYNTMGKWRIQKPLNLAIIAHKKDFQEINPKLKELHDHYEKQIKTMENYEDSLYISDYFSEEFGKQVAKNEKYKYKITAAFSEFIFDKGVDGIIYPPVQAQHLGFNVALSPRVFDNKSITFEKALVWRVEKKGTNVVPVSWLFCDKLDNLGNFIWTDTGSYQSKANLLWNYHFR